MTPKVVTVTPEQLTARRTVILDELGMTLDDFRRQVVSGASLSGDEWEARAELNNIAFLLGEEPLD